jgi:hypothetical protein
MKKFSVMGKEFDPAKPEAYLASFAIRRTDVRRPEIMSRAQRWAAPLLSALILLVLIGLWHACDAAGRGQQVVDDRVREAGGECAPPPDRSRRFPSPAEVGASSGQHLSDPFYDNGPNDKGIGIQLALFDRACCSASCWPRWLRFPRAS